MNVTMVCDPDMLRCVLPTNISPELGLQGINYWHPFFVFGFAIAIGIFLFFVGKSVQKGKMEIEKRKKYEKK